MQRFKYSLLAAAGVLVLSLVLTAVGPKRMLAALGYTPVRDVDKREPYQATSGIQIGGGGTRETLYLPPVPAGKRLVIEYATASVYVDPSLSAAALMLAGSTTRHGFTVQYQGVSTQYLSIATYRGDTHALAFVEAGQSPAFVLSRSGTTGGWACEASASGYLVSVP